MGYRATKRLIQRFPTTQVARRSSDSSSIRSLDTQRASSSDIASNVGENLVHVLCLPPRQARCVVLAPCVHHQRACLVQILAVNEILAMFYGVEGDAASRRGVCVVPSLLVRLVRVTARTQNSGLHSTLVFKEEYFPQGR